MVPVEPSDGAGVEGAATLGGGGCNPMCWRLQPYVEEAATLCAGGCNPLCAQVWKALHMTVLTSPLHDTVALRRVQPPTTAACRSCLPQLLTTD